MVAKKKNAKIIGGLYKQVLTLPSIQVIDIDKHPLKEKEESKERLRKSSSNEQEAETAEEGTSIIKSSTCSLSSHFLVEASFLAPVAVIWLASNHFQ